MSVGDAAVGAVGGVVLAVVWTLLAASSHMAVVCGSVVGGMIWGVALAIFVGAVDHTAIVVAALLGVAVASAGLGALASARKTARPRTVLAVLVALTIVAAGVGVATGLAAGPNPAACHMTMSV